MRSRLYLLALVLPILGLPAASAQTPTNPAYTVTNLGTLGGTSSQAYAINNLGQVVGNSAVTGGSTFHATLYSGTGSGNLDLGNLGGAFTLTSDAFGINDSGQVIGYANAPTGGYRAARYSGTGSNNTDSGGLGNPLGNARAINNQGQIVGQGQNNFGSQHAALFSGTGSGNTDLGTLSGSSSIANAINNSGVIVGTAANAGQQNRATRFGGGNFDLGSLGGINSTAHGINDFGQIVGYAMPTGSALNHATFFSGTGVNNIDLGTLGGRQSYAWAINNLGQIVGDSDLTGNAISHAFLYSGGVMSDINSLITGNPGVTDITLYVSAREPGKAINEWGQIAANGTVSGLGSRALRLDPVNPLTSVSNGGASRNVKFIGGMNYSLFTTITDPGNLGTTVKLLGGIVGNGGMGPFGLNRDVNIAFSAGNPSTLASDILTLTGTGNDTFALQLSYNEALASSLFGTEANARLGWFSGGQWILAVDGNSGGTPTFVLGPWNNSYSLGTFGVDTTNDVVWAVINHNSDFAVISSVPEPTTWALLCVSGTIAGWYLRRRPRHKRIWQETDLQDYT